MSTDKKTTPEVKATAAEEETALTTERIMEYAAEMPDMLKKIARKYNMESHETGALFSSAIVIETQSRLLGNSVDIDNIFEAAIKLDSMRYIMQDILEGFFEKFNPDNMKEDLIGIRIEFPRNRAKANVILDYLHRLSVIFEENGIIAYRPQ